MNSPAAKAGITRIRRHVSSLFGKTRGLFVSGYHSIGNGGTESAVFKQTHPLDGRTSGAAHSILKLSGMCTALPRQRRRTQHGLYRRLACGGARQACGYAAVSQRVDEHINKRRTAARQGSGCVNKSLGKLR